MGRRSGYPRVGTLTVTVSPSSSRVLSVRWHADAVRRGGYARILLAEADGAARHHLVLVDAGDHALVAVPESVPGGRYRVQVETFSSGSWGGGHLLAVGVSAPLRVAAPSAR